MSVDASQITQSNQNASPPVQPVFIDAQSIVNQAVDAGKQAATGLVNQAVGSLQEAVSTLFGSHDANAARIAALESNLSAAASSVETALVTRVKADPKIQAALILGSVGALWIGALAILIAALLGSHLAADWIGYAAGMFGASILAIITHALGLLGPTQPPPVPSVSAVLKPISAATPVVTTTTVGATP